MSIKQRKLLFTVLGLVLAVEERPCDCYARAGRFEDDDTRARPGAHDRDCISK